MGYRKAAKLRRTQHVSGHYRTSKSGKRYWVEGHVRNDPGPMGVSLKVVAIAVMTIAGLTLGLMFAGDRGQPNETKIERMQRKFGKDCERERSVPQWANKVFLKRFCTPYGM